MITTFAMIVYTFISSIVIFRLIKNGAKRYNKENIGLLLLSGILIMSSDVTMYVTIGLGFITVTLLIVYVALLVHGNKVG